MPHAQRQNAMSLHGSAGDRKYLNAAERRRFLVALDKFEPGSRLFGQLVAWTGCRLSEALALTARSFDLDRGVVAIVTLKRRRPGIVREVPIPPDVLKEFEGHFGLRARQRMPETGGQPLWRFSRTVAWRRIKSIMNAAGIDGIRATPKGLRHSYGVMAFQLVPPHLVQRWLGHASLKTTAIYGDVSGPEEQSLAARLWRL